MHSLGIQALAAGDLEQGTNNIGPGLGGTGHAGHAKAITAAGDFNVESAFDLAQVLIELAAKIGEPTVVGGLQDDVLGYV